jgi:hypothetical protein
LKSFYINPATNDLEFDGQNNIKMVDGDDELLQSVRMTIATNLNEWFLNPEFGFDRSVLQVKILEEDRVIDELYAAILQDERIASVEDITFDFDRVNRHLKIDFKFTKKDGQTVEGVIEV